MKIVDLYSRCVFGNFSIQNGILKLPVLFFWCVLVVFFGGKVWKRHPMRCLEDSGTEFSSVTAKTHTTESLSYLGATGRGEDSGNCRILQEEAFKIGYFVHQIMSNSICSHVSLTCNNLSVTGYPERKSKVTIPKSGKMTLPISNRLRWTSRWWALQAYHSTIQGGGCGEVARWDGDCWDGVHTELGGV